MVCGAKNYQVGDKVPLATVGALLPGGEGGNRQAPLRGVESFGMLCSARELGLSEEHEGLLILDPSCELGAPMAKALGLDDVVFEVNVTPNRADALSHLGIAREVATLLGVPVKLAEAGAGRVRLEGRVDSGAIRIEDPTRCLALRGAGDRGREGEAVTRGGCRSASRRAGCGRSTTWSTSPTT